MFAVIIVELHEIIYSSDRYGVIYVEPLSCHHIQYQGFSNTGAALVYLDRTEDALRVYAYIMRAFSNNDKEMANAYNMYTQLMKRLGSRAFNKGK